MGFHPRFRSNARPCCKVCTGPLFLLRASGSEEAQLVLYFCAPHSRKKEEVKVTWICFQMHSWDVIESLFTRQGRDLSVLSPRSQFGLDPISNRLEDLQQHRLDAFPFLQRARGAWVTCDPTQQQWNDGDLCISRQSGRSPGGCMQRVRGVSTELEFRTTHLSRVA